MVPSNCVGLRRRQAGGDSVSRQAFLWALHKVTVSLSLLKHMPASVSLNLLFHMLSPELNIPLDEAFMYQVRGINSLKRIMFCGSP